MQLFAKASPSST